MIDCNRNFCQTHLARDHANALRRSVHIGKRMFVPCALQHIKTHRDIFKHATHNILRRLRITLGEKPCQGGWVKVHPVMARQRNNIV